MRKYLSSFPIRLRFLWIALSLTIVAGVLLVACGGGQTTTSSTPTTAPTATAVPPTPTTAPSPTPQPTLPVTVVQMVENPPGHYLFQPASITIKAGTVVVWIDNSDAPHTVTSAFNTTQNVTQNKTFALQFNQAGTYHYHCNIHPTTMKAVIDVTA